MNSTVPEKPIQDFFENDHAVCYGCGRDNPHGLHIKTIFEDGTGICEFTPEPFHTAFPNVAYGGLIACVIDCHSLGTAVAAAYAAENRKPGTAPAIMYATANLNVNFLKPTPMDTQWVLTADIQAVKNKKTIVDCHLFAGDTECANATVIGVRIA